MTPTNLSRKRRRGAAAVEMAVVILGCLIFLFAIFEYGRFQMMRHLVDNAAREGARQAVVNTNTMTTADIQNIVTDSLAGQSFDSVAITVYKANPSTGANIGAWTDAAFGEGIAVQVNAVYSPMLPTFGFLQASVPISAKVIMRSEAN